MIEAKVICDSVSPQGVRLLTFKLRYPRFIHAEFMTHRMISRNASGSRAVPMAKLIEEARDDELRASPMFWGKNQKGMQAAEELSDEETLGSHIKYSPRWAAQNAWRDAARAAATHAERLAELGAHKQITNRILEPFTHINVVATATEWQNFFGLRLHRDAQPEIQELARRMWRAQEASMPEELRPGEWHLPFVDLAALSSCSRFSVETQDRGHYFGRFVEAQEAALWVSTARCARVSYESFETRKPSTVEEDVELFLKLMGQQPIHASPAEHQATPDMKYEGSRAVDAPSEHMIGRWAHPEQHGNLRGWRQHRKMIPSEAVAPLPDDRDMRLIEARRDGCVQ